MSNINSILLFLNNYLDIYLIREQGQAINKIVSKKADSHLNLAESFKSIWKQEIYPSNYKECYFIMGPKAGFTDTRIVYIWLRTSEMFTNKRYHTHQSKVALDFSNFEYEDVQNYLQSIKASNKLENIVYAREPNIGKAKL